MFFFSKGLQIDRKNRFFRRPAIQKLRIRENPDEIEVLIWLPGYIQDDISVLLKNRELTVTAISSQAAMGDGTLSLSYEEPFLLQTPWDPPDSPRKRFQQRITIPSPVEEKRARYLYENQFLKVWLPKKL